MHTSPSSRPRLAEASGLVSAAVIVPASAWAQTPPPRSLNARLLVSALDGDVIDIVGGSKSEGAPLDASPRNSAIGSPDQLWVLVEEGAPPGYFYIQSILNGYVVDINSSNFLEMSSMSASTPSQWWKQVPDPAGSGNYFIQNISNQAVIDIYGYLALLRRFSVWRARAAGAIGVPRRERAMAKWASG